MFVHTNYIRSSQDKGMGQGSENRGQGVGGVQGSRFKVQTV